MRRRRESSYGVAAPVQLLHARLLLRGLPPVEHLEGAHLVHARSMLEGYDLMFQPWRCDAVDGADQMWSYEGLYG